MIDKWKPLYKPKASERVGVITAEIDAKRRDMPSTLGNLIADSFLTATLQAPYNAEMAFMNSGGIRASLAFKEATGTDPAGSVSYEDLYNVLPFGNTILTLTLTGEQVRQLLEEQYDDASSKQRILGVSNGLSFDFLTNGTKGNRVSNLLFQGKPLNMAWNYQVTVPQNMLDGSVLSKGLNLIGAGGDLDALRAYMQAKSPVSPPPLDRVKMVKQ